MNIEQKIFGSLQDTPGDVILAFSEGISSNADYIGGLFNSDANFYMSPDYASLYVGSDPHNGNFEIAHIQGKHRNFPGAARSYATRCIYEVSQSTMQKTSYDFPLLIQQLPFMKEMNAIKGQVPALLIEGKATKRNFSDLSPEGQTIYRLLLVGIRDQKQVFIKIDNPNKTCRENSVLQDKRLQTILQALQVLPESLRRYASLAFSVDSHFPKLTDNAWIVAHQDDFSNWKKPADSCYVISWENDALNTPPTPFTEAEIRSICQLTPLIEDFSSSVAPGSISVPKLLGDIQFNINKILSEQLSGQKDINFLLAVIKNSNYHRVEILHFLRKTLIDKLNSDSTPITEIKKLLRLFIQDEQIRKDFEKGLHSLKKMDELAEKENDAEWADIVNTFKSNIQELIKTPHLFPAKELIDRIDNPFYNLSPDIILIEDWSTLVYAINKLGIEKAKRCRRNGLQIESLTEETYKEIFRLLTKEELSGFQNQTIESYIKEGKYSFLFKEGYPKDIRSLKLLHEYRRITQLNELYNIIKEFLPFIATSDDFAHEFSSWAIELLNPKDNKQIALTQICDFLTKAPESTPLDIDLLLANVGAIGIDYNKKIAKLKKQKTYSSKLLEKLDSKYQELQSQNQSRSYNNTPESKSKGNNSVSPSTTPQTDESKNRSILRKYFFTSMSSFICLIVGIAIGWYGHHSINPLPQESHQASLTQPSSLSLDSTEIILVKDTLGIYIRKPKDSDASISIDSDTIFQDFHHFIIPPDYDTIIAPDSADREKDIVRFIPTINKLDHILRLIRELGDKRIISDSITIIH